ncbi:MAG: response regulator [Bdellovibrionales bacterium]|nr:response regulator [Bdellovibrionales bacterium]
MKVLIIEDEILIIEVFTAFIKLQDLKCDIDFAQTGDVGLAHLEKTKYDIVLLDHFIPKVTGEEIAKNIRSNANNLNYQTPILLLSSESTLVENLPNEISNCQALMKPVKPKILLEKINELCNF